MLNLLIITQKVDEDDDLLGFFVGWLREFSKNFEKVFVVTLAKGNYNLPPNVLVYSLGKEKGAGRILRLFRFYRALFKLVPKSDGIFAHMSPIFVIASWPVAKIFGRKIVLWYLHRAVTLRLRMAEKMCFKIATAAKESLNLRSNKIIELGHGIDVDAFRVRGQWSPAHSDLIRILSVGRMSRIKNYETLIRAAKIMKDKNVKFYLKVIGRPIMKDDFNYFEQLRNMINELGLKDVVEFVGFVSYKNILPFYQNADLLINLAPTGGIDKVVLEAMAAGVIPLTSNRAFEKYFGHHAESLIFKAGDYENLSRKIKWLIEMPPESRKIILDYLRRVVTEKHDLEKTINKISALFR